MSAHDRSSLTEEQYQDLLNGPAIPPPDGQDSVFDDAPNNNGLALASFTLCLVLATVSMGFRAVGRWYCKRSFKMEDYMIVGVYITYLGCLITLYIQIDFAGHFVHAWNIRLGDFIHLLRLYLISTNFFAVNTGLVKAAILFEWARTFVPPGVRRNLFFWTCHVLGWANILFYIGALFVINLACRPYQKIWNPLTPGTCANTRPLDIISASFNFGVDLLILILPQRTIWKLSLNTRKKAGLAAIFLFGAVGCAAAGGRLIYTTRYIDSEDITYDLGAVMLWSVAEVTCGIIIFCLPAFPAAIEKLSSSGVRILGSPLSRPSRPTPSRRSAGDYLGGVHGDTADSAAAPYYELRKVARAKGGDAEQGVASTSGIMWTRQFQTHSIAASDEMSLHEARQSQ